MTSEDALTHRPSGFGVGPSNEFIAVVAEAGSFEEIIKERRRPDGLYQITCGGQPIDNNDFPILQEPGQDLTKRE